MEIFQASENFDEISLLKIDICLYQQEKQEVINVFEVVETSENLCMDYIIHTISTAEYMNRVWNEGDDKNNFPFLLPFRQPTRRIKKINKPCKFSFQ